MSVYCDVALPVPLDRVFTYELGALAPVVGARVMVPFGGQRLVGVVVRLHDVAPGGDVQVKRVERVLDEEALLSDDLMELGRWIASYYCAPLGDVLRGMVPVTAAEVRRQWVYRIGEQGRKVLFESAKGSSRRSKVSVETQNLEYAVLNYLESGDAVKVATIRSATGGNKALLDAMARKRWLVREPLAEVRDARRVEMVAVLQEVGSRKQEAGSRKQEVGSRKQEVGSRKQEVGSRKQEAGDAELGEGGGGPLEELVVLPTSQNRDVGHPEYGLSMESGGGSAHLSDDEAVAKVGHPGYGLPMESGGGSAHLSDDEAVAKVGHPGYGLPMESGGGSAHLSDDETVAKVGHPGLGASKRLPRLNENQLAVMAELAGCGGRELVRVLRARLVQRGVPETSLGTLVKRGLVRLEEVAQGFHVGGVSGGGKKFAHEHALNEAQMGALAEIVAALGGGETVDSRQVDSATRVEGVQLPPTRDEKPSRVGHPNFAPILLYGVTGSGKTAVYVAAMQRVLAAGRSALLLVPEIGLTPGTAAQMVAAFGSEVALLHSQLTPDERAEQWHRIRRGEARVVIGTRSAVFAPLPDLGLILVDEEHDGSYKQEETPRYHGRDVAVMRAKLLGIPVVLGSATPSLESWNNAERGRYKRVEMLQRVQERALPVVEMIDMREEFKQTGKEQLFSRALLAETQATLDRGEQAVILINRRGYSFVVMCRSCGEKLECENCAITLTYHRKQEVGNRKQEVEEARVGERLVCHYCGYQRGVPDKCPKCASEHLYYMGAGSQQGEERLAELFPGARIGRMDRDTVRSRGDMERLLSQLHSGEINLLVGTQMIAKGHDIHGVTLVGVVGADFALGLPDFRAAERVFQLLTQVSGRAGRGELPGKVLVQTYQPEHYVNQFARTHDYTGFAAREMYFRRAMRYPPLSVLANVIVSSEKLEEVLDYAAKIGRWFQRRKPEGVRVLGPAAAPNARLKRIYRYHLVLKADRRDVLGRALREMLRAMEDEGVPLRAVAVDVDPMHLM